MHCGQLLRAKPAKVRCPWRLLLVPAALDQEKGDIYIIYIYKYHKMNIMSWKRYTDLFVTKLYLCNVRSCERMWAPEVFTDMPRHGASRLVAVFAVIAEFCPEIVCCTLCGKQNNLVISVSILVQPTQPETPESLWQWQQATQLDQRQRYDWDRWWLVQGLMSLGVRQELIKLRRSEDPHEAFVGCPESQLSCSIIWLL